MAAPKIDANALEYAKAFVNKFVSLNPGTLRPHREDLVQEAVLGLLRANMLWDPNKGSKLSTVQFWWMRSRVIIYTKLKIEQRHRYTGAKPVFVSHDPRDRDDDLLTSLPHDGRSPEDLAASAHDVEWLLTQEIPRRVNNRILEKSRAKVTAMAVARARGKTLDEVGDEFKMSREGARQALKKLDLDFCK